MIVYPKLPNLLFETGHFYKRKVMVGHMHFHQIKHQLIASVLYFKNMHQN